MQIIQNLLKLETKQTHKKVKTVAHTDSYYCTFHIHVYKENFSKYQIQIQIQ